MKKILYLIFLFSALVQSQNKKGIAFYSKTGSLNFTKMKKLETDQKLKKSLSGINESINKMNFILNFNDSTAFYDYSKELKVVDKNKNELARVFSGYKGPYFFDLKSNSATRKAGKYLVKKNLNSYDWVLTKEKIKINNFVCYKATTTLRLQGRRGEILRPVVAWYTPDVNISAGPDGFGGLPGLIIQIEVNNVITTLTKIEFKEDIKEIKPFNKGEKITEEEFSELMKKMSQNRGE